MQQNLKMRNFSDGQVELEGEHVIKRLKGEQASTILLMFSDGTLEALKQAELISEFEIQVTSTEEVTIKQPYLTILAQHELPLSIFSRVGESTLALVRILDERGYGLIDAHAANWVFQGVEPKFVDFGSFLKKSDQREFLFHENEFRIEILGPLNLMKRNPSLGLLLTHPGRRDTDSAEFRTIMSGGLLEKLLRLVWSARVRLILRNLVYSLSKYPFVNGNNNLVGKYPEWAVSLYQALLPTLYSVHRYRFLFTERKIRKLRRHFEKKTGTYWSNYSASKKPHCTPRFDTIREVIISLRPKSLLDVGGNEGYLSFLLERDLTSTKFTTVDMDRGAIQSGVLKAASNPLRFSFGIFDLAHPLEDPNLPSASFRLSAEVVVCLALSHHILLGDRLPAEKMWSRLHSLTEKYVVIEFMPKGLWSSDQNNFPVPNWYSEDAFSQSMTGKFEILRRDQLELNRVLFVLKKI